MELISLKQFPVQMQDYPAVSLSLQGVSGSDLGLPAIRQLRVFLELLLEFYMLVNFEMFRLVRIFFG